jgi:hypothetical protein
MKDGPTEDDDKDCAVVATDWLARRDELVKVRKVTRSVEMTLEIHDVEVPDMIQFVTDTEMYGLYEAGMLLTKVDGKRWKVMESILTDLRLASLPKRAMTSVKPEGVEVKMKKTGLRPESIWTLQKELILGEVFDARAERIFDSVLPFSAPAGIPRPYTSQDFAEIAKSTSVWEAVHWAPIRYREALCQRLLVLYKIPEPTPAKNTKQHVVTGRQKATRDRVLVIDKAGNAWTWGCGWYMVGEDGQPKRCRERKAKRYVSRWRKVNDMDETFKPWRHAGWHFEPSSYTKQRADIRQQPMGHAEFRRVIKPADASDYARTSFRYTRPWGQWRKGSGPVAHDLFGNGTLVLTDGLHAVVDFNDGVKREVVLGNLRNIGERSANRRDTGKPDGKPKTAKPKKSASAGWDDML